MTTCANIGIRNAWTNTNRTPHQFHKTVIPCTYHIKPPLCQHQCWEHNVSTQIWTQGHNLEEYQIYVWMTGVSLHEIQCKSHYQCVEAKDLEMTGQLNQGTLFLQSILKTAQFFFFFYNFSITGQIFLISSFISRCNCTRFQHQQHFIRIYHASKSSQPSSKAKRHNRETGRRQGGCSKVCLKFTIQHILVQQLYFHRVCHR